MKTYLVKEDMPSGRTAARLAEPEKVLAENQLPCRSSRS